MEVSDYNCTMQSFFSDPDIERFPPETIRVLELTVKPLSNRLKLRTHIELTPFEKPPYLDLSIINPAGETCGGASIVEPIGWNLDLTLHIRTPEPVAGNYVLVAILSYPGLDEIDQRKVEFHLPPERKP